MHICQLSQLMWEYQIWLEYTGSSHIIHPISQIKSTYELFLLQFETQPIFPKFKIICFQSNIVWFLHAVFWHVFHHLQRL